LTSPQGRKQSPTKTRPSSSQPTSPDKKKLTKAEIRATNRAVQTTGDPRYLPVINDAMIKRVDAYLGIQRPQTFSLGGLK
jgi:hypothetical protein